MSKCMLTTVDNPYNPFEQFTSWFLFDVKELVTILVLYLARIVLELQINYQKKKTLNWKSKEQLMKLLNTISGNIYKKVTKKQTTNT